MAKKFLTGLTLVNLPSDPSVGSEGELYFNTSSSVARIYKSGEWADLDTVGGGSLSQEQIQDYVAPLFTNATNTNVIATYDDANNVINLNTSGSLISVDSITYPDYIVFDTTPETSSASTGTIYWDSGDGLLKTILNANVNLGIGQESVALVKNNSGSSISKAKVVYINGAQGQRPTIALADADTETTSSKTFGFTAESIANGAEGFVVTEGILRGINTVGLIEGDPVYLSGTAGNFTQTKPSAPTNLVFLGYVVKAHASAGEIFVKIQNGYELEELHDVLVTGIENDEILRYSTSASLWINTKENLTTARNYSNATINAFMPVYFDTQFLDSTEITFDIADALNELSLPANGITTASVAHGSYSKILTKGTVSGIDLTGYIDGDLLYVAASGGFTKTIPSGSSYIQPIARVLSTDNGTIYFFGSDFASSVNTLPNLGSGKVWYGTSGRPLDTTLNTTIVPEGSNLYFTDERAQDATSSMITNGVHTGISVEYVDSSNIFNLTNTGATSLSGTANEISVSASTGNITIGIPDSPVFVTPNIGTATATSINGTTIPNSASLVVSTDLSNYLTQSSASSTYQPIGSYLTSESDPIFSASDAASITSASIANWDASYGWGDHSTQGYLTTESDTLESVTDRGATSSNAIEITNTTPASSPVTGALVVAGGVGIGEDLYVDNDVHIGGDIHITGSISGSLTYVNVTDLVVTDPLIYLAESNPDDSVDIGIFGAVNHSSSAYYHTGLIRDASDSGKWVLASQLDDPTNNVVDFTGATYDTLKLGKVENTGQEIILNSNQSGSASLNASLVVERGSDTNVSLRWNESTNEWEYTNDGSTYNAIGSGGGGGSSAAAVTSDPPASPELNQVWQDLDTGRIYVWNGDFWIEVQQNGSLGLLRYLGAASTAPVTSIDGSALQAGEVYFDTVFNGMKVYDGTAWEDAFSAASLNVSRWVKTAVGGETSLSGNDDSSLTLVYTPGIEEVYLNGVKLIRGSDYIASSGSMISNLEPLIANSIVEVISYSGFTLANTYTKAEVDDLVQKQQVRWTEVAGAGTSITTLSGLDDYSNTLAYTPGTEQVFINGILMVRGVDYTATNGTSVVLNEALSPGDVAEVMGNSTFSVANTYTKTEVDNKLEDFMMISLSDEISTVVTGTAKVTMRAPFAMTLTQIPRASLNTASSSGIPTIDIKKNGTTILGANKLTIDANEKTSVTAATATTLATTAIANDDEITFDVTVAGTGAKGLKVVLYYTRA